MRSFSLSIFIFISIESDPINMKVIFSILLSYIQKHVSHRLSSPPLRLSYWLGGRDSFPASVDGVRKRLLKDSFVVNPWSADIRQEFLWGFISGQIQTKSSVQQWVVQLMAIRALQLLEESVFEILMTSGDIIQRWETEKSEDIQKYVWATKVKNDTRIV